MKKKGGNNGDDETEEITVYDYFVNYRKIDLRYSAELPCINVGKPKRPTYVPIEVDWVLYICLVLTLTTHLSSRLINYFLLFLCFA